jgi:hypothetical protein
MAEKEYIERRALTRKVRYIIEKHGLSNVIGEKLKKAIEDSTAADVVEVVRCKDCRFKTLTQDGEYNPEDIVCEFFMTDGMQENDFCSYGERREE